MEETKKKVYKRPMTAVNMWRQKESKTKIYEDTEAESDREEDFEEIKVKHDSDDELHVKQKITKTETMPVNVVSGLIMKFFKCRMLTIVQLWKRIVNQLQH